MPRSFAQTASLRFREHTMRLLLAAAVGILLSLSLWTLPAPLATATDPPDSTCPTLSASAFAAEQSEIHSRLYLPEYPHRSRWSPVSAPGDTVTACHTILNSSGAAVAGLYLEVINLVGNYTTLTFTPRLLHLAGPDSGEQTLAGPFAKSQTTSPDSHWYSPRFNLEPGDQLTLTLDVHISPHAEPGLDENPGIRIFTRSEEHRSADRIPHRTLSFQLLRDDGSRVTKLSPLHFTLSEPTPAPGDTVVATMSTTNVGNVSLYDVLWRVSVDNTEDGSWLTLVPGSVAIGRTSTRAAPETWVRIDDSYVDGFRWPHHPGYTYYLRFELLVSDVAAEGSALDVGTTVKIDEGDHGDAPETPTGAVIMNERRTIVVSSFSEVGKPPLILTTSRDTVTPSDVIEYQIQVLGDHRAEAGTQLVMVTLPYAVRYAEGSSSWSDATFFGSNSRRLPDSWIDNGHRVTRLGPQEHNTIRFSVIVNENAKAGESFQVSAELSGPNGRYQAMVTSSVYSAPKIRVVPTRSDRPVLAGTVIYQWFEIVNDGEVPIDNLVVIPEFLRNARHLQPPEGYPAVKWTCYGEVVGQGIELGPSWEVDGYTLVEPVMPGCSITVTWPVLVDPDAVAGDEFKSTLLLVVEGDNFATVSRHSIRTDVERLDLPLTAENVVCLYQAVLGAGEWQQDEECKRLVEDHIGQLIDGGGSLTATVEELGRTTKELAGSVVDVRNAIGSERGENGGLWGAVHKLRESVGHPCDGIGGLVELEGIYYVDSSGEEQGSAQRLASCDPSVADLGTSRQTSIYAAVNKQLTRDDIGPFNSSAKAFEWVALEAAAIAIGLIVAAGVGYAVVSNRDQYARNFEEAWEAVTKKRWITVVSVATGLLVGLVCQVLLDWIWVVSTVLGLVLAAVTWWIGALGRPAMQAAVVRLLGAVVVLLALSGPGHRTFREE